jgi:8-oxo-dGTP pyrophosphatase MutT (NUDIX family)
MIDQTWYVRPANVKERVSAGGVIVRRAASGSGLDVALAREGDFASYVLPKGGVEDGESIEQAARREIAEEAGLDNLTLLGELGTRGRLTFNKKKWVTVHYFAYLANGEAGRPTDVQKHYHPASWFPIDRLPEMFWPEQRVLVVTSRGKIEGWVKELANDE